MIDISKETVISLAEAARRLPTRRAGRSVSTSCIYRWTVAGCRGVRLEWTQIGATRVTSLEALQRFADALAALACREPIAPPPPAKRRRRAIAAAEQRLAREEFNPTKKPRSQAVAQHRAKRFTRMHYNRFSASVQVGGFSGLSPCINPTAQGKFVKNERLEGSEHSEYSMGNAT